MINLTITFVSGNTKKMSFDNKNHVEQFIAALPNNLDSTTSLHVRCDLLGISGIVRGNKK
jgi:hypothetical protein